MECLLELLMDLPASWVIKNKNLSTSAKSALVFVFQNLLTIILVALGCLDMATKKVGFYIFAFVVAAIWLAITIFIVIRGHKKNWNI